MGVIDAEVEATVWPDFTPTDAGGAVPGKLEREVGSGRTSSDSAGGPVTVGVDSRGCD